MPRGEDLTPAVPADTDRFVLGTAGDPGAWKASTYAQLKTQLATDGLLSYVSGDFAVGNYDFNVDETVGAGQDNFVLTYDDASGKIGLEAAGGGGLTNWEESGTTLRPTSGGYALGDGTNPLGVVTVSNNTKISFRDTAGSGEAGYIKASTITDVLDITAAAGISTASPVTMTGGLDVSSGGITNDVDVLNNSALSVYSDLDGATNYERLRVYGDTSGNIFLRHEAGGTGNSNGLVYVTGGSQVLLQHSYGSNGLNVAATAITAYKKVEPSSDLNIDSGGTSRRWKTVHCGEIYQTTSTAADPTTTEYATSGDWGIHKNTSSGNVFLAYNDGGAIKKVQLT